MIRPLTALHRPDEVSPDDLDDWLARGFFRVGQAMMSCRVLWHEDDIRSAVWTRLPLDGHGFKRSHRKLLSRLERRFRIEARPAVVDAAHEAVYARYVSEASGERPATLAAFRATEDDHDRFDTWSIDLWDGDRLAAFSWFDRGRTALQSLLGAYDPAYADHSLGFASLLLEIRQGLAWGAAHHYSGYVLPGVSGMDYKRRVGPLEALFDDGSWRPLAELPETHLPDVRMRSALRDLGRHLEAADVPAVLRAYPHFALAHHRDELAICVGDPLLLTCGALRGTGDLLAVRWDLEHGVWQPLRTRMARAISRDPEGQEDVLHVLVRVASGPASDRPLDIVQHVLAERDRRTG